MTSSRATASLCLGAETGTAAPQHERAAPAKCTMPSS